MPKISLDNLERYDGHLKDWCDARFAERKVHENWHEAGPSGAVSFYPVPNRPIDPVVNFAFTETLPEGTKGPDNPSTITGVSSITVTRCETVGVDSTDYTVNLGGTYYGGSVDLSTGVMTVMRVGERLTSVYSTSENTNTILATIKTSENHTEEYSEENLSCNMFDYIGNSNDIEHIRFQGGNVAVLLYINKSRLTYSDSWNATVNSWLSANNVFIVYKLLTPYTVQLTTTQIYSLSQPDPYIPRINTIYSDQQSILVKYPKSPIVSGSELDDAILSLGGD